MKKIIYYTFLSLFANKSKNLLLLFPILVLLFLLFSSLFLKDSIEHTLNTLSSKTKPIYGRYYISLKGEYFLLVGLDSIKSGEMIVSNNIENWLKNHYYQDSFNFLSLRSGDLVKIKVAQIFPKSVNLIASDVVILNSNDVQKILGDIKYKKILQKSIFNYQGGFFIIIYTVFAVGFLMILYLRYNQIVTTEEREIKILRATGWSKIDILKFKLLEELIRSIFIISSVFFLSYIYVFIFNAPFLSYIFTGGVENIQYIPYIKPIKILAISIFYILLFIITLIFALKRGEKEPLLV